jgi:hypothetical protein
MRSLVLEDTRCLAWQEVPEPQRQHEREAIVRLRPQLVTSATIAWDDAPEALLEPATKLVISRI